MADSGHTERAAGLAVLTLPVILVLYLLMQWLARLEERRAERAGLAEGKDR
jgi:iron(III) transport system permease protein